MDKKTERRMEDLHPVEFEIFKLIKRVEVLEKEMRLMTGLLYHIASKNDLNDNDVKYVKYVD